MRDPLKDGDGVDRPETDEAGEAGEVHENTRSSEEGVEATPETNGPGEPAAGLIGNGEGVDPRYLAQR